MKRTQLLVRSSILTIAVMIVLAVVSARAQELKPTEKNNIRAAVAKARAVSMLAVTMEFADSFESVGGHLDALLKEVASQKIGTSLKAFKSTAILILHEDPTGKQKSRMSIGLIVPSRLQVKAPLKIEEVKFSKAVRHTHIGPYEQLEKVHHEVELSLKQPSTRKAAKAEQTTSWPVVMLLRDDPKKVGRDKVRNELIIPLKSGG